MEFLSGTTRCISEQFREPNGEKGDISHKQNDNNFNNQKGKKLFHQGFHLYLPDRLRCEEDDAHRRRNVPEVYVHGETLSGIPLG